jgi:uncharacterized surface protein with fasciclin (FAS1) repeats
MAAGEAQARGPYNSTRSSFLQGLRLGTNSNIPERLDQLGNFTILLAAVEKAGLSETLAEGGPFTLFAPTDAAFIQLLSDLDLTPQELLNSPELGNILLYHVLGSQRSAGDLLNGGTANTLYEEQPVLFTFERNRIMVNGARILRKNIRTDNGVINIIDSVLLPPDEDISVESIVDLLRLDGRFSILLQALETAGLDDDIADAAEITLFAPTDAAFVSLLGELDLTAEELLNLPSLADILLYHVVGGDPGALNLLLQGSTDTLLGESVTFGFRAAKITVNQAIIISPNVSAPNGSIQVIDGVLLP